MRTWDDRETYLLDEARRDLERDLEVRPCLLAVAGDQPLLTAFLRGFGPGRHLDALIEVVALAAPLGADRLALSVPARAWSLDDPGDLGRQVVVLQEVDGSEGPARSLSSAFPYELVAETVRWGTPLREGGLTGLMAATLLIAVRERRRLHATDGELRDQASRCVRLGHMLAFAEPVFERLVG